MVASILEGMGMVEKATNELGGHIYKGPAQAYDDFKKNLWDSCGATTEHNLKKAKLSLTHVEVKEEHRYPIEPPQFVNNYLAAVKEAEVVVPEELKEVINDKHFFQGNSVVVLNFSKATFKCYSLLSIVLIQLMLY